MARKREIEILTPGEVRQLIDTCSRRAPTGNEPIDLYEIVRARRGYERGSMILASNRDFEEWYPLFRDDLMASAAMDLLLHHAHVVVMQGHSFRNPPQGRKAS